MNSYFWKWLKLSFDRSFSIGKPRQLIWLICFLIFSYWCFYILNKICDLAITDPVHILELLIDPGAAVTHETIPGGQNITIKSQIFSFFIAIFGAIFFTGALVSIISNILEIRVESYNNGLLRYRFTNHILILGGNNMITGIISALASNDKTKKKDIVVLSTTNSQELLSRLRSELTAKELCNVILLFGNRDSDEELINARLQMASCVYIIGENNEQEHDSINISCCERIKRLVPKRNPILKCNVVLDNLTSYHVFQYKKQAEVKNVEVTLIDTYDSWAQQVLVSRESDDIKYPAIDRDGIDPESDYCVHFIVIGMTQMAIAMGNCVAHLAHYPNFVTKNIKTKISFIAPNIEQEMNFFKGHYQSLFKMVMSTYRSWNFNGEENIPIINQPDPKYGDFLDIEWEFLDGGIETPYIRRVLSDWCKQKDETKEIMTIAVCGKDAVNNMATTFYLPDIVHKNKIPIFVYQPNSCEILKQANSTDRYAHVFPFGMKKHCYDTFLHQRIIQAKKYNYLYTKESNYIVMTNNINTLNTYWYKLSFANQLSNIYAANSIYSKLRSMKAQGINLLEISDDEIELYAEVEHNRWNVEKLLVGFSALTINERQQTSNEKALMLKQKSFIHKDIAPYKDLDEESKKYDRLIVRFMNDIIK